MPIPARRATDVVDRHPAVTDANLWHLAGTIRCDSPAARCSSNIGAAHDALLADVGSGKLALTAELAALGVVEMVDENMANAARVHAIESGKTYGGRTLDRVRWRRPGARLPRGREEWASTVCWCRRARASAAPSAFYALRSATKSFAAFTKDCPRFDIACGERPAARTCVSRSARPLWRKAASALPTTETRTAYMRYVGQGHEIPGPTAIRHLGRLKTSALPSAHATIRNMPASLIARCRGPMSRS